MSQIKTAGQARTALLESGYKPVKIRPVNEGSNHFVFDVILEGNRPAILKFAKIRETEAGLSHASRDTLCG